MLKVKATIFKLLHISYGKICTSKTFNKMGHTSHFIRS